jgi:hypothetical protein
MISVRETEQRMALRHVQKGRECIGPQMRVLAALKDKGLPTVQAERVLRWLEETQRQLEEHYHNLPDGGSRLIEPRNIDAAPFVDWEISKGLRRTGPQQSRRQDGGRARRAFDR